MTSWLVTGGAGYIGSHVVKALREHAEAVVVIDDLSTGDARRIADVPLLAGSVLDLGFVCSALSDHSVSGIVHLAAKKQVSESISDPLTYYRENVGGLTTLLEAAVATGVEAFVFSSSASAYGTPDLDLVAESTPCAPVSPYGETKLFGEWMSRAVASASGIRTISLRYFNVAGAASARLSDPAGTNLIPLALRALTSGSAPKIFGDDYPTADGTCIRDYVHVADVADAHVAAIRHLQAGGSSGTYNVGRGEGSSVREVLRCLAAVTGIGIEPEVVGRRAGDPARVVAAVDHIRDELGWSAHYGLRDMIASTWEAWQSTDPGE